MTFKERLGLVYLLLPFISVVNNRFSLLYSILFEKSEYKVQIANKVIKIPGTKFGTLRDLLACLTYSISYSFNSSDDLEFRFDENNTLEFSYSPELIYHNQYPDSTCFTIPLDMIFHDFVNIKYYSENLTRDGMVKYMESAKHQMKKIQIYLLILI